MGTTKRATVYFDPLIYRALCLKAAALDRSISDMVNEAVKQSLAEDAKDLAAFDQCVDERALLFENVVKALRQRGMM